MRVIHDNKIFIEADEDFIVQNITLVDKFPPVYPSTDNCKWEKGRIITVFKREVSSE